MKKIKLYGYANSPFVRKSTCFLYYKGVDFTHVPVDPINPKKTIGFTDSNQVPVLQIGDEWRHESSEHAYWLDQEFPNKPLCPAEAAQSIRKIDDWVSNTFLLNIFRPAVDGKINFQYLRRSWRLATLMNTNSPVPIPLRIVWPLLLRRAPFIQNMATSMDLSERIEDMNLRILNELKSHIGPGPFIGGLQSPSMLDLAVYPNIVWSYMFGVSTDKSIILDPTVNAWLRRVAKYLPENPSLTPDSMIVNPIREILN
ncbi:MAG: glutathione S-transferase family protein [Gammaproteobacteria bacterium]|nr:glutathione S-transferase family protein [Gammaproteobacteria bacterium]